MKERYQTIPYTSPEGTHTLFVNTLRAGDIGLNEYWIYNNPNEQFDGVITKNNLPQEWLDKLHDKEFYFPVMAAHPKLFDIPTIQVQGEEDAHQKAREYMSNLREDKFTYRERSLLAVGYEKGWNDKAASDSKKYTEETLGENQPWPLTNVLKELIWSAEYLLDKKNYDGHNHEEILICVRRGKEILQSLSPQYQVCEELKSGRSLHKSSDDLQPLYKDGKLVVKLKK